VRVKYPQDMMSEGQWELRFEVTESRMTKSMICHGMSFRTGSDAQLAAYSIGRKT
jgi:hypothetical protein